MGEPRPGSRPGQRVTMTEAAELLGMSRDAVRMRVRRGSLASEKGEDGRVYVFLEPDQERDHPQAEDETSSSRLEEPLIEELRDQVGYLREQLRREQDAHAEARRIIAALTARIPEIEAPSEPREAPTEATEQPGRVGPQTPLESAQAGSQRAPWWRRIFGE
jgi:hypothetical protein